jgi:hypothetical protein
MKKTAVIKEQQYHCEYCKANFVRESSLFKHLCAQKRRWLDKDTPASRLAFAAWSKFYSTVQPSIKERTFEDFMKSAYYSGFAKFGTYAVETKVVNPLQYVDWLIKSNSRLDSWATDTLYGKYLIEYLRLENSMDAIKRSVETLIKLSESENVQVTDVLRYVNANRICLSITGGHISPWLLYHSSGGIEFLGNLNEGQTGMIFEYINPDLWNIKFKRYADEVADAKSVLKAAGL